MTTNPLSPADPEVTAMDNRQMLDHEQKRLQRSFKKAEEIVKSWPKWKREYKLTKY